VVTGKETRKVTVDEEYVKRSIYDPNADVVEGFMKGLMVSYQGQLSEDDIANIIEYLKTVK
jgi:cytochrome c oxidase subunit 2